MASDTKVASASTDGFTGPLPEGSLLSRLYVAGLVRQVVANDDYLRFGAAFKAWTSWDSSASVKEAQAFGASEELKTAMQSAGVVGAATHLDRQQNLNAAKLERC